jgi:antitoxin (DNA-binding transcriptional repressor) of toxin-antitoxin stability system
MIAAEALYDGAPVAHIVAFQERRRLARIERVGRELARRAPRVRG